jgi:hypothetical protein
MLLFWDGRSAAPSVVATLAGMPPQVALNGGSLVPARAQPRAWQDTLNPKPCWIEVRLGENGPAFHWLGDGSSADPGSQPLDGPPGLKPGSAQIADWPGCTRAPCSWIGFPDRPTPPEIACLCANREGGVWFGAEDGLHFVREKLVRFYTTRDGLSDNQVRAVSAARNGDVWAATSRGLSRWHRDRWDRFSPTAKCLSVALGPADEVWLSSQGVGQGPIQRASAGDLLPLVIGLEFADPSSLLFASDETLWIACDLGITWIRPQLWAQRSRPVAVVNDGRFFTRHAGNDLPVSFWPGRGPRWPRSGPVHLAAASPLSMDA